jgi:zeaxanthin glucosyltransferase
MKRIGIVSPPVSGHLNPFSALGRALLQRGHQVVVFQMADIEAKARAGGMDFCPLGFADHPLGSLPQSLVRLSQLKGLAAIRFTVDAVRRTTEMFCRDGPQAIRSRNIDLLLVDQMEPAGGTLAEHLGLPFITICNGLAFNREPAVPPPFAAWEHSSSPWARMRNHAGYGLWDRITKPIYRVVDRYRRRWNLPSHRNEEDSYSRLAQISQQPPAFDFPRRRLPPIFHYVGPLRFPSSEKTSFPWESLDGRPMIYASLGTLQNRSTAIFQRIAQGCDGVPAHLVINHVGGLSEPDIAALAGSPTVVPYAPQVEVLAKARLTITHAGLNTVLDSLSQGVPMVAIPLTAEQPAIAARLKWVGAGIVVPYSRLTPASLRRAVEAVLSSQSFYDGASRIAASIQQAGGVERAVQVIEEILRTGKPVTASGQTGKIP